MIRSISPITWSSFSVTISEFNTVAAAMEKHTQWPSSPSYLYTHVFIHNKSDNAVQVESPLLTLTVMSTLLFQSMCYLEVLQQCNSSASMHEIRLKQATNIAPLHAPLEFSNTFHYPAYFTYFYLDSFRTALKSTSSSIRDTHFKGCRALRHMDAISLVMGVTHRKLHSQGILTSFTWEFTHAVSAVKWDLPATSVLTAGKAGTSVSRWQLTTSLCWPNGNWISTTLTETRTISLGALENYVDK